MLQRVELRVAGVLVVVQTLVVLLALLIVRQRVKQRASHRVTTIIAEVDVQRNAKTFCAEELVLVLAKVAV